MLSIGSVVVAQQFNVHMGGEVQRPVALEGVSDNEAVQCMLWVLVSRPKTGEGTAVWQEQQQGNVADKWDPLECLQHIAIQSVCVSVYLIGMQALSNALRCWCPAKHVSNCNWHSVQYRLSGTGEEEGMCSWAAAEQTGKYNTQTAQGTSKTDRQMHYMSSREGAGGLPQRRLRQQALRSPAYGRLGPQWHAPTV